MDINSILEKFKDKNGFIGNVEKIISKLIESGIEEDIINQIVFQIKNNNQVVLSEIKKKNKKLLTNKDMKEREVVSKKYIKESKNSNSDLIEKSKEKENIDYYISYIGSNLDDKMFLTILPKTNTKENINTIDRIIAYYFREINFINSLLVLETNENEIEVLEEMLITNNDIYEALIEYKKELLTVLEIDHSDLSVNTLDKKLVVTNE